MTLFVCSGLTVFAQEDNLVPNGSFESIEGKVKKLGSIENATGWFSPTGARADLYSSNKNPEIDVPNNIYGKEEGKEGENYAGIVNYSFGDKVPRTYLSTKLTSPLKKGMRYCVQFHVSLAEGSKYASNNIAANLSKKPFGFDDKKPIVDESHIMHEDNKVFTATYSWEKVCGIYEAEGGEKYITIGNFTKDEDVKKANNKKSKDVDAQVVVAAYYYIDMVSVSLIDEGHKCDCGDEDRNEYSTTIYQNAVSVPEDATAKEKIEALATYYAFGKSLVNSTGENTLESIAELLKENSSMRLEIVGHSDAMEDQVAETKTIYSNMAMKRANKVQEKLVELGVDGSRLRVVDKGSEDNSSEIIETDDEDLKMAKNRRVTFVVK